MQTQGLEPPLKKKYNEHAGEVQRIDEEFDDSCLEYYLASELERAFFNETGVQYRQQRAE